MAWEICSTRREMTSMLIRLASLPAILVSAAGVNSASYCYVKVPRH